MKRGGIVKDKNTSKVESKPTGKTNGNMILQKKGKKRGKKSPAFITTLITNVKPCQAMSKKKQCTIDDCSPFYERVERPINKKKKRSVGTVFLATTVPTIKNAQQSV